jgi:uncharacterized protein
MYKYLVLTIRTKNFQESALPLHGAFLDRLRAEGKLELAGPFTDKTGGAYMLKVGSLEEAKAIAQEDPVHTTGSSLVTVYEWKV